MNCRNNTLLSIPHLKKFLASCPFTQPCWQAGIYLSIRPFRLSLDKYRYDITTPIIPASASTKSGVLSIGTKTSYTKLMKTIMIEIILMIFIFPPEINTVNPVHIESISDKEKLVT